MSTIDTQAAPAPLQVRVKEAEEDILKMAWTMASCSMPSDRQHYAHELRRAVKAALDLSTPPQIAALEAEIVKLRGERDEWKTAAFLAALKESTDAQA